MNQWINQWINKLNNESINESNNQTMNQVVNQWIHESFWCWCNCVHQQRKGQIISFMKYDCVCWTGVKCPSPSNHLICLSQSLRSMWYMLSDFSRSTKQQRSPVQTRSISAAFLNLSSQVSQSIHLRMERQRGVTYQFNQSLSLEHTHTHTLPCPTFTLVYGLSLAWEAEWRLWRFSCAPCINHRRGPIGGPYLY